MQKFFFISIIFVSLTSCIQGKYKDLEAGIYADIQTNKGNILLELYTEYVPKTVANFIALVEGTNSRLVDSLKGKNFYDNIIFHRVVPNFVKGADGLTDAFQISDAVKQATENSIKEVASTFTVSDALTSRIATLTA